MYPLVLLLAATALLGGECRSANVNKHIKLLTDLENQVQNNEKQNPKKFIKITITPPTHLMHQAGKTLELTCEALGGPAPSIHWFKNDAPIYEFDKESTETIDSTPSSIGRVSSTLLVRQTNAPMAVYTCLAVAGFKTAQTVTTVYKSDDSSEISERTKLVPLAPRILVSYKVYVDTIGNTIVLPCRVKGHPKPTITWKNNHGSIIKRDPRMTVLRSGELVISSFQWSDMGEFTCQADNLFGSTEIKTFVYPARPNESDG